MENNLMNINMTNEQFTIDSREVAEMTGKRHDNLLRDISGYIEALSHSSNLRSEKFFIESSYLNGKNQKQPCYLLTKKGCDMVANKMSGTKGIIFTAMYVDKFNDMENFIKDQERAQLQATITKFEMLTQEIRQYFKPLHRTKLEYNRLIKSLTSNNQEANLVKRWVFMKMGVRTWEDTCLDDSTRIMELIQSTSKLVQIDNFEQITLLQ